MSSVLAETHKPRFELPVLTNNLLGTFYSNYMCTILKIVFCCFAIGLIEILCSIAQQTISSLKSSSVYEENLYHLTGVRNQVDLSFLYNYWQQKLANTDATTKLFNILGVSFLQKINTAIVLKKIKVLVSFSLLLKTEFCAFFKLKAFNITQNKFQTNPVGIGSITPNDDWIQF